MDPAPSVRTPDLQQVPVLSLEQIRSIRASNDYVERPVALEPSSQSGFFYAHEERAAGAAHPHPPRRPALPRSQSQQHPRLSRSSTVASSASRASAASDQWLLAGLTSSGSGLAVCAQPKAALKPRGADPEKEEAEPGLHLYICERCGRCKCRECVAPRRLPHCLACGGRCLCSPDQAVEYLTCLCCVQAFFYHCCTQDPDADCSDRPCSCGDERAAARWGAMALLTPLLPCLCCYPPARLCVAACRRAHDRATRPGCRCGDTNTVRRKRSVGSKDAEKPS